MLTVLALVFVCAVLLALAVALVALAVEISGWKGAVVVTAAYVLLAFQVGHSTAQADVTVSPSAMTGRIDQMIGHMLVPVVDDPQVIVGDCPGHSEHAGCTYAAPGSPVWIQPQYINRFNLFHELGHRYRFDVLGAGASRRFVTIMRYGGWSADVEEQFADAYATCALGWLPRPPRDADEVDPRFPTGYQYEPSPSQQRQVCGLIARAAA